MTRILRLALPLYLVVLFNGSQLHAATAHWTQPSSLAEARSGSAAAVLSDGRVLITGGTGSGGPLATTEIFNTDGSFSASAPMLDARANHTEVVLQDGRVLVAGGVTTGGAITNTAEIYDPSSNTWTLVAGGMSLQRSGHSASLLSDGHVLIAGGQSPSGPTNTLETFSPATNTFTLVTSGTLVSPRTQHAAAVLADGRVLIAGGSDGTNALKSADIFDPSSGNVSPAASMSMPRVGLSATTLLDGTVLIAGGNNGNADLASAEIYDPIAAAFTTTGNLSVARSGHLAFLLPNNNEVLVAGGTSSGTPLASAELFVPWTGSFSSTGAMAVARTAAAGSPLKQNGQLLVAGGSDGKISLASSELYSFATVMTDKADYPPGTTVNISGSGWQPGETVTLTLVESPLYDTHGPYTAVADSNGNIFNNQFMTDEHDANIRFYLTAKGSVSQGQMTFTDGSVQTISGTVTDSATGNPISGAKVSCSISSGCNNNFSTITDGQGRYSLAQVTFSGNSATLTLSASAAGYKGLDIQVTVTNTTNNYPGNDFKLTPTTTPTALSVASSTGTYGGATTVAATLTSGGSPVSGKSITFTLNGIPVGSATTAANGLAQLGNVSLPGINAGTYNAGVAASFVGDPSFGASSNTANLTVNKATANVSVTGYNTTYDGTAHTATGTAIGVKGENLSGLSLSGTIHTNAGTYTDAWVFADSTGNYNSTGGTVTDIIAAAAPGVITPIQSGTSTYGTSVTLSVTLTAPAGAETPTGSVQFQFTNGGTTYNICSNGSLQTQPAETPCTITLNNGTATVTTSNLPAGTSPDAVTATYNPAANANYTGAGVSTTINYTVSTASTQTAISITPTTGATYGDTVTLSSAVSDNAQGSTGTPTGTVQFQYSTDGGATWINIGGPVTLDTSGNAQITTTALPAGQPAVRAHYSGDSNFAVSDSGAVAYKVDRKTLTVTGITASNKPYDGKTTATVDSSNAQLVGVLANDDVHLVTSGVTGTFADANSGTGKTVTAQGLSIAGTAASNYTLKQPTTTANITAVQVTVTAPSFTVTYGDPVPTPLTPTYNAFVNGEDSTVLTTQPTCTTTYTPGSSAGSNPTTSCSGAVAMNYTFGYVNGTVTVNKANATINVTPYRVTYDGTAHTATGTATGVKGETLSGLNLSGTTHTDAGTYTSDTWTFADATGNYNSTSGTVSDSIAKATPTVSITGGTFTYDTHPHPATAIITGVANDNSLAPSMVTLTYTPGDTVIPVNAGTYSVAGNFTGNQNYNPASGTATIIINKANATITVEGGTYTYDANPHPATATITGVSGDNSLTASLVTLTYAPGGTAAPVNAGSYSATGSFAGNGNYNPGTSNTATVTINKADAKISVTPYNLTYDGAAHTATGTAISVKGEPLSGLDLSKTTHTDAGTYASDSWTFTDSTGNYNNTSGTVSDSIAKANATVTVTGGTYTYDAKAHPATATVTGIAGDSSLAAAVVTFTYTPGGNAAPVNAGSYPVSGAFAGSQNYNPASGTATITINKATPTLTVSGGTYTYDGNPHPGSVLIVGAPGDSSLTSMVTLAYLPGTGAAPVNAGSYSVTGSFAGTDNYNSVTSAPANITINPADAKITVYGYTGTYDGHSHGATGSAIGVKGEDLSGFLSLPGSFIDVPGGTVIWTFTGNNNYKTAGGTASISISAASTATSLVSSLSQSSGAATVTLTATVGSSVPPVGGTVTFTDTSNNAVLGTAGLTAGTGSITIPAGSLPAGPHLISAAYVPASLDFSGSASTPNPAPGVTITNPSSGYVSAITSPVSFSATFSGIAASASPSAEWTFTNTGTNASTNGIGSISGSTITGSNTFASAGVFGVTITFTDGLGDVVVANTVNTSGAPTDLPATVVIYDPSAGFVTGGGWIDSPLNAYAADPSLTGKATFGFVSKYQKGANVPTGDTQFTFQTGKLDFHSTSYQWLVISGPMAQYKGSGTINGAGNYNFLLTARDGSQAGKNTPDGFRIKITDASTGGVIYDNVPGNSDAVSSGNTQAIGGGSIIIHGN